jgi:hypothetical protein
MLLDLSSYAGSLRTKGVQLRSYGYPPRRISQTTRRWPMHRIVRALRFVLPLAGALVLAIPLVAGGAPGDSTHPPGNNGTVKIDALPFDDHPNNEPHVGCLFQIDFYNYDEGALDATYTMELWSPTGSGALEGGTVFIGEDPNGGGTDLDASVTIDLGPELAASGQAPHPVQGFHVRLTIHAEGSIGADVKHKMFWVRECVAGTSATQSASESTSTSSPPGSTSGSASTSSPPGGISGSTSTSSPPGGGGGSTSSPTVLGASGTSASPPGRETAFTGDQIGWLIAVGLTMLIAGTAALRVSSRIREP